LFLWKSFVYRQARIERGGHWKVNHILFAQNI
jgi:hypothetical protein